MNRLSDLFILILLLVGLQAKAQSNPVELWQPVLKCEGPSGSATLDEFHYYLRGHTIYLQQFVIRTEGINQYFEKNKWLEKEIAKNLPEEIVIAMENLAGHEERLPLELKNDRFEKFSYRLFVNLPELRFVIYSKSSGEELGNWIFRECALIE